MFKALQKLMIAAKQEIQELTFVIHENWEEKQNFKVKL